MRLQNKKKQEQSMRSSSATLPLFNQDLKEDRMIGMQSKSLTVTPSNKLVKHGFGITCSLLPVVERLGCHEHDL